MLILPCKDTAVCQTSVLAFFGLTAAAHVPDRLSSPAETLVPFGHAALVLCLAQRFGTWQSRRLEFMYTRSSPPWHQRQIKKKMKLVNVHLSCNNGSKTVLWTLMQTIPTGVDHPQTLCLYKDKLCYDTLRCIIGTILYWREQYSALPLEWKRTKARTKGKTHWSVMIMSQKMRRKEPDRGFTSPHLNPIKLLLGWSGQRVKVKNKTKETSKL